MGSDQQLFK